MKHQRSKKLKLKKMTISKLDGLQMMEAKGGFNTTLYAVLTGSCPVTNCDPEEPALPTTGFSGCMCE